MVDQVHHFRLLKYLMLTTGHWKFKSKNQILVKIYYLFRRIFLVHFLIMTLLLGVTIPMSWKCRPRVMELTSLFIQYMNIGIMVIILIYSPKVQQCIDYTLNYERDHLENEGEVNKVIYDKYCKLTHKIISIQYIGISIVGGYWYATSQR